MKAKRVGGIGTVADAEAAVAALRPPQAETRGMQELLPRMRTDGVAEQRIVGTALDTIGAAVLHVGPAGRQVRDAVDVVIDDRAVAKHRADDAIAAAPQDRDESLQAGERHEAPVADCRGTVRAGRQWKLPRG